MVFIIPEGYGLEENKSQDWESEQTVGICLNWQDQRIQVHENNVIKIFGVRNMTLRSTNFQKLVGEWD